MDQEFHGQYDIWGGDIDPSAVELSRHNAELAGVDDCVRFEVADAGKFHRDSDYGQLVTNPPYGERLLEKREAEALYRSFGKAARTLPAGWRVLVLSSHTEFERAFGRSAGEETQALQRHAQMRRLLLPRRRKDRARQRLKRQERSPLTVLIFHLFTLISYFAKGGPVMRHVFLINPHAGKQDQTARIRALADRLAAAHNLDCRCLLTDRPGGAEVLSRALAETGEPVRIYACGGDGTVHEAANGIAGFPNAAMTVIPAGTGNDFLKNFGPDAAKFSDPEHLWDGPEFPLDLIDCNGRLCLTIACSGIDARIADTVHRYGNVPGLSGRGVTCCPWR